MALTREQLAVIHVAKKELQLDDDLYRTILRQAAGVSSSKDLDTQGFDRVMSRMKQLGFKRQASRKTRQPKDGQALVLPSQMELISQLYDHLGWDDRDRRVGFNRRQIRKPWPQTRLEANKVIEGLKAMIRRKEKMQS